MKWSEVYTQRQKTVLLQSAVAELKRLKDYAIDAHCKSGVEADVEITSPSRFSVLILRNGAPWEREFYVSGEPNNLANPDYRYAPVSTACFAEICEKYRLTPVMCSDARVAVDKKIAEKSPKAESHREATEELTKLIRALAPCDMLSDVVIATSGDDSLVMEPLFGLAECGPSAVGPVWPTDDLAKVVQKYRLTPKELAVWREKIERS